jgi:hypothetical protein
MGNIFNPDFQDFIKALNQAEVRYILVGGYAVILYGYSRTTGDIDIWVERTEHNYEHVRRAFQIFGMPVFDMTQENFLQNESFDVFTFGIPPVSIDIMLAVKGLEFRKVYPLCQWRHVDGIDVMLIDKKSLLKAKRESGRFRDLDDIEQIELL